MQTVIKKIVAISITLFYLAAPFSTEGYSNPILYRNAGACGFVYPTTGGTPITCSGQTLGNNRLLIVDLEIFNTGITSVTYGGIAMTQLRITTNPPLSNSRYYLINPPLGVNTVSVTPAVSGGLVAVGYSAFENVNQVNWYNVESGATGVSVTLTTTIPNTRIVTHIVAALGASCDNRLAGYPAQDFLWCNGGGFNISGVGHATYEGVYTLSSTFPVGTSGLSINATALRPAIPNTYPILTSSDNSMSF